MLGGVSLLLDEFAHEIPQQLRARAVACFGRHRASRDLGVVKVPRVARLCDPWAVHAQAPEAP